MVPDQRQRGAGSAAAVPSHLDAARQLSQQQGRGDQTVSCTWPGGTRRDGWRGSVWSITVLDQTGSMCRSRATSRSFRPL